MDATLDVLLFCIKRPRGAKARFQQKHKIYIYIYIFGLTILKKLRF